ncbi:TPA: LptF/LptG family permease [Escherichia coli]|uniref:LptF/LptG family permease n=1 Tax=Shigella flexneri TaxID=623 RepID=UPI002DC045BF|nr:LptF/LptG family permease [Escherichia coli]HAW2269907.1 LptF/LptG family permease [Escherichia coli]HAW2315750.1 LptF/LptG family permease [Escherichia coli]
MNVFSRYLIRHLFLGFAAAAGLLLPLFTTFNLINELDDVSPGGYRWTQAVLVVLMTLPRTLVELSPFIALLGGIVGLGQLSKNSELTAIRSMGFSIFRGKDTGHFGMIDAIDDPQVFAALFGAAEAWLKSQGASKISGPFSLNINQESGLLIEGFDTPPCAMMPHGKPWYAAHIEQLGYHKGIDLLAWWMQRTDLTFSPALKKLMDQVRKKVTIRCINRQRFAEEMQILREIFNSGWQHNWGFVPFTEHEFATMGDQLKYLVPDDMIYIAEIDSAPCAFIVGLPNINEAIADLNGSLFPFGWAKLLWRLKVSGVRTARVPLMGVRDEYQFSRIGPVIALLLIEALRDPFARRKIDALEMSWILETNTGMNNMLERIGAEPYKRYRLYEKQI